MAPSLEGGGTMPPPSLEAVTSEMTSSIEIELVRLLLETPGKSRHAVQLFNQLYLDHKSMFRVVAGVGGPLPFVENCCTVLEKTSDNHVKMAVPFVVCRESNCKCKMFHVCKHWPSLVSTCKNCHSDPVKNPDNAAVYRNYPLLQRLSVPLIKRLLKTSKFVIRPPTPILFEKCESDMLSFPKVCEYYNSETGCLGSCLFFHLCRRFAQGICNSETCLLSHDFKSSHNQHIVKICSGGIPMEAGDIIRVMNSQTSVTGLALNMLQHQTRIQPGDAEICVWNLVGECGKGDTCPFHHLNLPFWWQYETDEGEWESWDTDSILILEKAYSNPIIRTVEIKVKDMIVIIDFPTMTILDGEYRVRRMSTAPAHASRHLGSLATSFHWHWEEVDNVWHEFPSCVTQGKHFPQLELPSHVIELAFLSGAPKLQFNISDSTFTLLFGGMQMKEEGCSNMRKICRRPIHRTVPHLAGLVSGKEDPTHEYWSAVEEASPEDWEFVVKQLNGSRKPTSITKMSSNIIDKQLGKCSKGRKMKWLFHPVVGKDAIALAQHGLLLGDTPREMQQYGSGVHLSTNVEHTLHFSETATSVLLVEAAVGDFVRGKATDTAPPVSHDGKQVHCCVNNVSNPEIYVFYDVQCLRPKYWITF